MKNEIPASYVVYLYGHMFASSSFPGHKHIVTGKRLNPVELRKAIKLATIVSLYNAGIIDFEIRTTKKRFRKRQDLVIKLLKDLEQSNLRIEKDMAAFLKEKGELVLNFGIPKIYGFGFDEKRWMDFNAMLMNKELAEMGYLSAKAPGNYRIRQYVPNEEAIKKLEHVAAEIKEKISEFKEKRKDIWEKLYANL